MDNSAVLALTSRERAFALTFSGHFEKYHRGHLLQFTVRPIGVSYVKCVMTPGEVLGLWRILTGQTEAMCYLLWPIHAAETEPNYKRTGKFDLSVFIL